MLTAMNDEVDRHRLPPAEALGEERRGDASDDRADREHHPAVRRLSRRFGGASPRL